MRRPSAHIYARLLPKRQWRILPLFSSESSAFPWKEEGNQVHFSASGVRTQVREHWPSWELVFPLVPWDKQGAWPPWAQGTIKESLWDGRPSPLPHLLLENHLKTPSQKPNLAAPIWPVPTHTSPPSPPKHTAGAHLEPRSLCYSSWLSPWFCLTSDEQPGPGSGSSCSHTAFPHAWPLLAQDPACPVKSWLESLGEPASPAHAPWQLGAHPVPWRKGRGPLCLRFTARSASSSPQTDIPKEKLLSSYVFLEANTDSAKASNAILSFKKKKKKSKLILCFRYKNLGTLYFLSTFYFYSVFLLCPSFNGSAGVKTIFATHVCLNT